MAAHRVSNPPNPWLEHHVDWEGEPPEVELEVYEEQCKDALSENTSPDIPFRFSLNPYRGCYHGCAYCYARPTHQYLGWGAGTDFDRRIVVKTNIADRLRARFDRPSWRGDTIALSGNTDCYQPLEASYELTQQCLQTCLDYRNPVAIITKSSLIRRDLDLLQALDHQAQLSIAVSIPFANNEDGSKLEPWASRISKRFETVQRLSQAGLSVTVALAPVIPGLNDSQIPAVLERAKEAGASTAFMVLLRLPAEVLPVFGQRLEKAYPLRVQKVRHAIEQMRGGKMNSGQFGKRMTGTGARWQAVEQLFQVHRTRLGLTEAMPGAQTRSTFSRPTRQQSLW